MEREMRHMNGMQGFTVWFTGMTNSGKSTLAQLLKKELTMRGLNAAVIDGAEIRKTISEDLGFNDEDREKNVLRMGEVCNILTKNGIVAIAAAVSPAKSAREKNRKRIGRYIEVWCRCSLDELKRRDTTEFYRRAEAGEIQHVAGIDDPYDEPVRPEVVVDTDLDSPAACVTRILITLELLQYVGSHRGAEYTSEEEALIKKHLKGMGYL
jgi:adenylylsulfate kinase